MPGSKRSRGIEFLIAVVVIAGLAAAVLIVKTVFFEDVDFFKKTTAPSDTATVTAATEPGTTALPTAVIPTVPTAPQEQGTSSAPVTVTSVPTTAYNIMHDTDNIIPLPTPQVIAINEENWELTIVNVRFRMPEDYVVRTAPAIEGSDIELDYRVAPHYQEMYDAAAAEGCYLTPYSGYRRYSTQDSNYNNKTAYYEAQGFTHEEALALAARVIMPPGSSEHNLGLCMDIYGTYDNWYTTWEYAWLMEHAQDDGFILRYPREKQVETQVEFEPWHWRYVGVENAKLIKESGLCLEEFLNSPIYDAAG